MIGEPREGAFHHPTLGAVRVRRFPASDAHYIEARSGLYGCGPDQWARLVAPEAAPPRPAPPAQVTCPTCGQRVGRWP